MIYTLVRYELAVNPDYEGKKYIQLNENHTNSQNEFTLQYESVYVVYLKYKEYVVKI